MHPADPVAALAQEVPRDRGIGRLRGKNRKGHPIPRQAGIRRAGRGWEGRTWELSGRCGGNDGVRHHRERLAHGLDMCGAEEAVDRRCTRHPRVDATGRVSVSTSARAGADTGTSVDSGLTARMVPSLASGRGCEWRIRRQEAGPRGCGTMCRVTACRRRGSGCGIRLRAWRGLVDSWPYRDISERGAL